MITYPRSTEPGKSPVLRLIGVGNAGVNIADRIAARSPIALETVAANSDRQSVSSSVAAAKVAIGPMATHGLGAGGDPDMALEAARESMQELKNCVAGADVVFLCAGLGGGTGSATVPVLAKLARESGAFVAAVVTSPFEFEGRRRAAQARQALVEIEPCARSRGWSSNGGRFPFRSPTCWPSSAVPGIAFSPAGNPPGRTVRRKPWRAPWAARSWTAGARSANAAASLSMSRARRRWASRKSPT